MRRAASVASSRNSLMRTATSKFSSIRSTNSDELAHGTPDISHGELARRALEELLRPLCFQRCDPARNRRFRSPRRSAAREKLRSSASREKRTRSFGSRFTAWSFGVTLPVSDLLVDLDCCSYGTMLSMFFGGASAPYKQQIYWFRIQHDQSSRTINVLQITQRGCETRQKLCDDEIAPKPTLRSGGASTLDTLLALDSGR
jgi:hypothetical protein